ncbi:amidohydrolase [Mesobacillus zeae]|uniref:Amidohydrolase n=1 Tax=Mesobacillus zeae TaxID=1917180 RepID=A0A398B0T2_9BACI|nr:amidohydrolase [Mesobacillus zeae]RID82914.1 amidohydrolase [Mesobacillus zeae]
MQPEELLKKIQGLAPTLVEYRRDFHTHPEPAWKEFRTTSIIVEKLIELGYSVKMGSEVITKSEMMGVPSDAELRHHMKQAISQGANPELVEKMAGGLTGAVAELHCGEGPVIALRFDIDSNDIEEVKDESHRPYREGFSSKNSKAMHACGHDGHAAMGLGVAEILAGMKEELKGTIRIIFQPGEEGVRGARAMVASGVVDGVDYIIGGHIGFKAAHTGDFICGTGKFLATTKLDATFKGVPAHAGAAPQEGKNALLAAAAASLNLHAISRHGEGASRINVGVMEAGQGRNILPPNAIIKLETRGENSEIDEYMVRESMRVIEASAKMYDVEYDIKTVGGTKSGESSMPMVQLLKKLAESMPQFTNVIEYCDFGAAEDYSHFMSVVQENGGIGTYYMLGSNRTAGHHDDHFDFDESVLPTGVELNVRAVLDIIANHE